jgi:hypothetical protein
MEDIKIGYIYKLVDNTNDNVYYGSTTLRLNIRLNIHNNRYKLYLEGKRSYMTSFEIIKNNNYNMIYLEVVPFKDIYLLHERERWYIENMPCVNKYIPNRSNKEWIEDNKEHFKNINHKWQEENKEHFKNIKHEWAISRKTCNICNYEVSNANWSAHIKTATHINNMTNNNINKS